jgi:hypothetical protein
MLVIRKTPPNNLALCVHQLMVVKKDDVGGGGVTVYVHKTSELVYFVCYDQLNPFGTFLTIS